MRGLKEAKDQRAGRFREEGEFFEDHVNMGVEVQLFAEGMQAGTDGGDEMTFLKPGENSFGGGFEEEFQERRMLPKDIPEVIRDGEGDMVVSDVG